MSITCNKKVNKNFQAECDRNTWRCGGEDICLPMKNVCDGFENCYDGSDEGDHCDAPCHGPLGEHCTRLGFM